MIIILPYHQGLLLHTPCLNPEYQSASATVTSGCLTRGETRGTRQRAGVLTWSESRAQWRALAWQSWGSSCCPGSSCQSARSLTAAAGMCRTPGSPPTRPPAGSLRSPAPSWCAPSGWRMRGGVTCMQIRENHIRSYLHSSGLLKWSNCWCVSNSVWWVWFPSLIFHSEFYP